MINGSRRAQIGKFLENVNSIEDIYDLFTLLNYPENAIYDPSYTRDLDNFEFKKEIKKDILKIYSVLSVEDKLNIYLVQTTNLKNSLIRYITKKFSSMYIHFLLIFTNDFNELDFVFPNFEKKDIGDPKLTITRLSVDTKNVYFTDTETISNLSYQDKQSWRDVWIMWRKAFDVERVNEDFFDNYKNTFFKIRNELLSQKIQTKHSHEFTLLLLNRIMFIYFVAKKGWLPEIKFIQWLWKSYKINKTFNDDTFYSEWLTEIFFKAFNNKTADITNIPKDIKEQLYDIPFLNGGLFKKNPELDDLPVIIGDKLIDEVISFFNKYNFTIKEDMPYENEVAVDPQMIGYVYESLANVAEEIYDRNDLGIFYTPRVEVDFMCRNTVVQYILNHLNEIPREHLYHFVFDAPEIKESTLKYFSSNKLWRRLEELLENVSVVDPACGSGAFLVGMLNVLAQLMKIVYTHLDISLSDFEIKNRIIARSLYGVDIMPWAIEAAELRLWLQLIIETALDKDELRKHALLPNLNMNLRIGDSLVQEIGGLDIHIRNLKIPGTLKDKLNELKNEKVAYINNELTAKYKDKKQISNEERSILQAIVLQHLALLVNKKKELMVNQTNLLEDETEDQPVENKKLKEVEAESAKFQKIYDSLIPTNKKPFIWDIDFIEIFGTKNGFDIVIGNPPYVRQEMISPPNKIKAEVTAEQKKEYKEKLIHSVMKEFPAIKNINKRSDLYIYFYFHGLNLLNEKGVFCYITSNSWLDVLYGATLQEFLCKYVPIYGIFDNPKRSFAHADVNTIIALFGAPSNESRKIVAFDKNYPAIGNNAKFVMFRKPFEEVISAENLIEIDNIHTEITNVPLTDLVQNVVKTNGYRVFPIIQDDLLEDGWDYPEESQKVRFKTGSYEGNKWGSKFLRASDIFYTILEKGNEKLIKFGKIVSFTQRNTLENFKKICILKEDYLLNKNYPYLSSIKDIISIKIKKEKLLKSIKKTTKKEIKYIVPDIISNRFWGSRLLFIEGNDVVVSDTFFVAVLKEIYNKEIVCCLLNSTLSLFITELIGRKNLGGGLLTIYGSELRYILLMNPKKINKINLNIINKIYDTFSRRKIQTIFQECGLDPTKPIHEQEPNPLQDRKELDNIIFDELCLTEEERKEVYWAVCELVKQRLDKAKSVKKK